jgi:hypothetical protein
MSAADDEFLDLVTGVYIDGQGRKWFCLRFPWRMDCSCSGRLFISSSLEKFRKRAWKLTKDQAY